MWESWCTKALPIIKKDLKHLIKSMCMFKKKMLMCFALVVPRLAMVQIWKTSFLLVFTISRVHSCWSGHRNGVSQRGRIKTAVPGNSHAASLQLPPWVKWFCRVWISYAGCQKVSVGRFTPLAFVLTRACSRSNWIGYSLRHVNIKRSRPL